MLSVTAEKLTPIRIKSIEATKMDLLLQNSSTVNVMTTYNTNTAAPCQRDLGHRGFLRYHSEKYAFKVL